MSIAQPTQATQTEARTMQRGPSLSAGALHNDVVRTLLGLLACALGVLPLNSLFRDSGWLWDAWFAMAIVVGPAALMRLRRPASTAQIWLGIVLLVPWLTLRFVHQHAIAGVIPGPGTWHDVRRLLVELHQTTAHDVAPVHTTTAIKLVLCLLAGLVAALVDLLAVVGRRGALAGVPLLVIYTVSGAVPRHPVAWPLFVLSGIGFLILLAMDSRDDLQRWGHYIPRSNQSARRAVGAISAQRIAVIALALAVVIPLSVPSDSRNWLSNLFHNGTTSDTGNGLGSSGVNGIDPLVTLKGELTNSHPVTLMTVNVQKLSGGTAPVFYLRENVLPNYDGKEWVTGTDPDLDSLADTQFASSPGTSYAPVTEAFNATITIKKLSSDPPIFVQPQSLRGLTTATQWSQQDSLLVGGTTHSGETYTVQFDQPDPTVAELNDAGAPGPDFAPWLRLPTIAASVRSLTASIVASADTEYQRALAINNYFTNPDNGFTYSLHTVSGTSGDPLVDFLQTRTGFCQQYAAAEAVMFRVAGIPSRVVLGYTHPTPDTSGNFTVSTSDAHAWVEAYFDGIGWIPFDATPLAGITDGAANDLPWAQHDTGTSAGPSTADTLPVHRRTEPTGAAPSQAPPTAPAPAAPASHSLTPLVLALVLLLVLLVLLGPWWQRTRRRRSRLRAGRDGDALAVWTELSDTATDLGLAWSPARTPRQVAEWLRRSVGGATGSLDRLAAAVESASYAPAGQGTTTDDLAEEYRQVSTELRANRMWRDRIRARFLPASLGWTQHWGQWMRPRLPRRERRH